MEGERVVRLDDGNEAVRAYVSGHTSRGLEHVLSLLRADHERVVALIGDLSEAEGTAVTPADEWSISDALRHLAASLDRSRERLETLSSGRPYANPPGTGPGQMGEREYATFDELRETYTGGMEGILNVLERADPELGLELTADHARFGPFNWLEWAIYSHHVHTHDHIGQIEAIRAALRA